MCQVGLFSLLRRICCPASCCGAITVTCVSLRVEISLTTMELEGSPSMVGSFPMRTSSWSTLDLVIIPFCHSFIHSLNGSHRSFILRNSSFQRYVPDKFEKWFRNSLTSQECCRMNFPFSFKHSGQLSLYSIHPFHPFIFPSMPQTGQGINMRFNWAVGFTGQCKHLRSRYIRGRQISWCFSAIFAAKYWKPSWLAFYRELKVKQRQGTD